jgi:hypothetical protein
VARRFGSQYCFNAAEMKRLSLLSKRNVGLSLLLTLSSACTFTQKMPRPLTAESVAKLERELHGKTVKVTIAPPNGPSRAFVFEGRAIKGDAGFLEVYSERYGEWPLNIPTPGIRSITTKSRALGTLEGVVIGGLAGMILGAIRLSGTDDNPDDGYDGEGVRGAAQMAVIMFGAGIGALIGVIAGHDTTMTF